MNTEESQRIKYKKLRLMGWVFIVLAILCSGYAFFTAGRFSDREGFYMISAVFILMSLYCFKPSLKH